uniref:Peptidase S8/S53 domain-containing protein n=1 Tax=Tanacetum cinerariifolium TaxID=118510 RepID=A0A699IP30_TANCI|nr:peptidase S8/S53 domain-containing protein [Tanacetum cinerariifolium]
MLNGEALYQPKTYKLKVRPLVYPTGMGYSCSREELKLIDVKGKIVLCDAYNILVGSAMGAAVKKAGGAAIIFTNNKLTGNSVAVEVQITVFSSRGPNIATTGILKPDIVGPGVDILAACHKSVDNNTGTQATFNIISGTSMSYPHLASIAALIKSTHPDWSPALIKSAIITTASNVSLNGRFIVDERDHPADICTIGSGHMEVQKANDPGLILDIQPDDYIPYLCGLGYTPKKVQIIVKKIVTCSKTIP